MDEKTIGAEQELYLAPEEEIKNAEEIAQLSLEAEKYPFIIQYDLIGKETLITELARIGGIINKQLDFANCLAVSMSMAQLKAIKTLNCVERVEKDYDYKILAKYMTESEYSAYLAGENPNINTREEIKLVVFDTGFASESGLAVVSSANFADDAGVGDLNGHGTQMAGIVSALVADLEEKKATPVIYSVTVADHRGFAKTSSIMQAIDWAINNEIKIINMSFGDYHKSNLLENMIDRAAASGIVMVAAAGNDGGFNDEKCIMYPAAFDNVLSVGAKDGKTASNYSSGGINADCFALGTQNTKDVNGNDVSVIGTSAAAAFVSGTILKNWCIANELSSEDIRKSIKVETALQYQNDENSKTLTSMEENGIISHAEDNDSSRLSVASVDSVSTMSLNNGVSLLCDSGCGDCSSNDMSTAINVPFFSWQSGYISCPGNEVWYKFTTNVDEAHPNYGLGWYGIQTTGSMDTQGYLYDSYGHQIGYNDDGGGDLNFKIATQLEYGETYYVCVKGYGSNTGNFSFKVDYGRDDHGNTPDTATEIIGVYYEDKSVGGSLHSYGDVDYYTFVPARNCVMEIYTEGDTNTYGQLYCASGGLLDSDTNSNGNGNFKITAHLEGMKRYYIAVSHNSSTGYGDYTLRFKFVKDFYNISNDYYFNHKKSILSWHNSSYTSMPQFPEDTSTEYWAYLNKASALLWKDKFLSNKSFAEALLQAVESSIPSDTEIILSNAGIYPISGSDIIINIIVNFIVSLIEPVIDRFFFNQTYENMLDSELMKIKQFSTRTNDDPNNIFESSYGSGKYFDQVGGGYIYGQENLRGEWRLVILEE